MSQRSDSVSQSSSSEDRPNHYREVFKAALQSVLCPRRLLTGHVSMHAGDDDLMLKSGDPVLDIRDPPQDFRLCLRQLHQGGLELIEHPRRRQAVLQGITLGGEGIEIALKVGPDVIHPVVGSDVVLGLTKHLIGLGGDARLLLELKLQIHADPR